MAKAFMAIIETPNGVWESTATVCSGHEAEVRARRGAEMSFVAAIVPQFMRKGLERAHWSLWECARENGCKCVVQEVEINDKGK